MTPVTKSGISSALTHDGECTGEYTEKNPEIIEIYQVTYQMMQ